VGLGLRLELCHERTGLQVLVYDRSLFCIRLFDIDTLKESPCAARVSYLSLGTATATATGCGDKASCQSPTFLRSVHAR
jgi:hypothetical protein